MTITIEAIYENGVLRPLQPIKGLKKNQHVDVTVSTTAKKKHPLHGLCGILPDADALEMLKTVEEEFEKVDINEW
jgi:predicted DNA-binding antitoxin AbrB/MazE fold protein